MRKNPLSSVVLNTSWAVVVTPVCVKSDHFSTVAGSLMAAAKLSLIVVEYVTSEDVVGLDQTPVARFNVPPVVNPLALAPSVVMVMLFTVILVLLSLSSYSALILIPPFPPNFAKACLKLNWILPLVFILVRLTLTFSLPLATLSPACALPLTVLPLLFPAVPQSKSTFLELLVASL